MLRKAKILRSNGGQTVVLPKEFQFETSEVFLRKQGDDVILSPRPSNWSTYLASGAIASQEFMSDVVDLPVQDRESSTRSSQEDPAAMTKIEDL
jgi:antitoxin VapB